MTNENLYDALLYGTSVLSMLLWFTAILTVGLKLTASNGQYRLLALLLVLCIVFTMQSTGLLFNGIQFASDPHDDISWQFRAGTIWIRAMSIFGATAVLWYGRPMRSRGSD